ncbi:MAG: DUF1090 domain-containing protein [Salinicola sp.]|uniref:DUF1090 domain-containing protein n=1 Tax=Salinicola sp. TaxID=1978524 RepID=UPI001D97CE48|nr:DUF1090 domain-containing protein [Salinicola sp.]NRB57912.1 DUF1090 domain-containing protein [Salinicola sp.]
MLADTDFSSRPTIFRCAVALILTIPMTSQAVASDIGCEAKRKHLEQQLAQADTNHQSHRAAGLRRALNAVEDHCTTASLISDSRQTLADLEEERQEQREALDEATREDDREDIAKHRRKLKRLDAEIASERHRLTALEALEE